MRRVILPAKKSTARTVVVTMETEEAVRKLQESRSAKDEDIMFPAGDPTNPSSKWVRRLRRYFKRFDMDVSSHDFRVTTAT